MAAAFEQVTEVAGYRLAERIGAGGMGEVYKAYNASLNRYAAVKMLYQASLADRFKNEAYIQSSISHPNIARLYEYTTCGNRHCIVMEYVEGETLDALLHRKRKLSNEETEDILQQIVSALAYLHGKEILHRDIKPQNFKLQPDGTVKMLDFGIAKHRYSPKFTQAGFIVGTTEYLAPEQFQQEPVLKSDVWALAVMTYELVTGYTPFEAANPVMQQAKIRRGNFTNPKILVPQISDKLFDIIEKGLRVNPANRISAAAIKSMLGKRHSTGLYNLPALSTQAKKIGITAAAGLVVLFLFFTWLNKPVEIPAGKDHQNQEQEQQPIVVTNKKANSIIINTPGISNAELELKDGSRKQLPYTVSGSEGDQFIFTIHAAGYRDKEVQVVLTPRRISYEFNLEKINN